MPQPDWSAATLAGDATTTTDPSRRGAAVVADRYQILGLLGAGGMGTVYRARDTVLDEHVAIKVLHREYTGSELAMARFRQEVKLARRVTHRNVARTFDIGEHAGDAYLTMEYVDGASLARRLQDRGALDLADALRVAAAIADGLAAAHAVGVVHRDLKPDNVLLAGDGRVVLTDFGIAHSRTAEPEAPGRGMLLGTPAYMAPEQVQGRELDDRADIYALGLVVHELLTGDRVWPGDDPLTVAVARLTASPPDLRERPGVPDALAELVARCLARAAGDRPGAADVAAALHALAAATLAPGPTTPRVATPAASDRTVALLPFRNLGAPEDAWIADGLTDDLIDTLCMTRGLKVRARGVVWPYKDSLDDPRDIGRRIDVQVVVEGSVRRVGDALRISARLIGVADGFQLWAQRLDCKLHDLLRASDEAARAIAGALSAAPLTSARPALADTDALELLLRSRRLQLSYFVDDPDAIAALRGALARTPDDPRLLSECAIHGSREAFNDREGTFHMDEAITMAAHAIAVAPHMGEPWVARAHVLHNTGDTPGAVEALHRAVANAPSLAGAHDLLGRILLEADLIEPAMRHLERAIWLDPNMVFAQSDMLRAHALRGEWTRVDDLLPTLERAAFLHAVSCARLTLWRGAPVGPPATIVGANEHARRTSSLLVAIASGERPHDDDLAYMRAITARATHRLRRLWLQVLTEIALAHGDIPGALDTLVEAVDAGMLDLAWLRRCPLLAPLRGDPAFTAHEAAVERATAPIVAAYHAGPA